MFDDVVEKSTAERLAESGEFVEEFTEEGFAGAVFAVAATVGAEIAAGNARGVGGMRRGGVFDVFGERSQKTDDVAEAFLFVGFGHADDGAERVSLGIITGICRKGSEDDGHGAQAPGGLHMAAEIIAGALDALAFDFGDKQ